MNRKLKAAIVEKFGTQYAFADAAELHESQISRLIRGRNPQPSEAMKGKIASLLGIDTNVFDNDQSTQK